ncbi:hypothetical protein KIN20_018198, partial [Parelaphostrongylus tenuis]
AFGFTSCESVALVNGVNYEFTRQRSDCDSAKRHESLESLSRTATLNNKEGIREVINAEGTKWYVSCQAVDVKSHSATAMAA